MDSLFSDIDSLQICAGIHSMCFKNIAFYQNVSLLQFITRFKMTPYLSMLYLIADKIPLKCPTD
jgi:hypothetical protein